MRQIIFLTHAMLLAFVGVVLSIKGEISTTNQPLLGVFIHSETRTNPPMRMFVAEVDLQNTNLHLRVSRGGPDPDGPGKWQTSLLEPTKIAAREGFDFVVNGDFFQVLNVNDGEGKKAAYRASQWSLVEGPAMTDGNIWSTSEKPRPCLVVHAGRSVTIETLTTPEKDDLEVVGGNTMLVKNGVDVAPMDKERYPRTVVGINAAGDKLVILLVDGRKPGIAVGMTYEELATEMVRLGCQQALNLDGGGSSVMAVRDMMTGQMKVLNEPTDGHERAVANVLGISVYNH